MEQNTQLQKQHISFTAAEKRLMDQIMQPALEKATVVLAAFLASRGLDGNWTLEGDGATRIG